MDRSLLSNSWESLCTSTAEDWLCKKLENLNLVWIEGYPSKSSELDGLLVDQFLRPPKSQSRWYGIHPAEPKDPTRPGKYVNTRPNDAAKHKSAFGRMQNDLLLLSHHRIPYLRIIT